MHICDVSVGSDNACCRLEDIRKIKLLCQMESFALSGSLVLLYLVQFVYQCVTGVILCCRRRKTTISVDCCIHSRLRSSLCL